MNPLNNLTPAVKNLLIINLLMFGATIIFELQGIRLSEILGLYYFDSPKFEFYQIFTYMFMHGSIGHIFMNMFGIIMFGPIIENRWGTKRFVMYYLLTGLGSGILYTMINAIQLQMIVGSMVNDLNVLQVPTENLMQVSSIYFAPCVGASGALFGILTAFAFLYPNTPLSLLFIPIPIKAKYFVAGYAAIELFLGIQNNPGDNIAHFAHLGGAVTGLILLLIFKKQGKFYS